MEKRELTNIEKLLIQFIYSAPTTIFNSVSFNYAYIFKEDEVLELLCHEILYPLIKNMWPYSRAYYANLFTKTILKNNSKLKVFNSEEFFSIIDSCRMENKRYNSSDSNYLKKEAVGRLAKLTKEISEDDLIKYISKSNEYEKYINVILREHPDLKKSDAIQLLLKLNNVGDVISRLRKGNGETEAFALTKISIEDFKTFIDRFSVKKIFKSKATLEFLISHENYLEELISYNGIDFIWEIFNARDTLSPFYINFFLKKIGYKRVFNEILKNLFQREWRTPKNKKKGTVQLHGYYYPESTFNKFKFILDYKIIDNLELSKVMKTKLTFNCNQIIHDKNNFQNCVFDDIRIKDSSEFDLIKVLSSFKYKTEK